MSNLQYTHVFIEDPECSFINDIVVHKIRLIKLIGGVGMHSDRFLLKIWNCSNPVDCNEKVKQYGCDIAVQFFKGNMSKWIDYQCGGEGVRFSEVVIIIGDGITESIQDRILNSCSFLFLARLTTSDKLTAYHNYASMSIDTFLHNSIIDLLVPPDANHVDPPDANHVDPPDAKHVDPASVVEHTVPPSVVPLPAIPPPVAALPVIPSDASAFSIPVASVPPDYSHKIIPPTNIPNHGTYIPPPSVPQQTCPFWKMATCRFGDTCRYKHGL